MKAVYCPCCGGRTKRNGRTSSGFQCWRCTACGASTTLRYDDTAARFEELLGRLLSKGSQAMMPGGARSFRRRTAEFREIWPMPVPDGELHRTLYVDGIWAARPCGAHMLQRREDGLLVHGKVGELEGVVDSHGSDPDTRGGLHRRLERVRQGHARDLAAHQSPEVHLPRLLEGQALHDNAAEAPGGARALRHRVRPHGHRHAKSGRARG